MQIIVLRRVKDKFGNILYFECTVNGVKQNFDLDQLISLKPFLINATVRGRNVVAKSGSTIETVIDYNYNITPYTKSVAPVQPQIPDYWGKDMISACRYIRKCAQYDNIVIQMDSHKSNKRSNLLLETIKDCGMNVKDFVRQYLSNIQPYVLQKFEESSKNSRNLRDDKTKLWVKDICYKSYLIIKLHNISSNSPIVVFFHESNTNDEGKGSSKLQDLYLKPCAVVIDRISSRDDSYALVRFTISRGLQQYVCEDYTNYFSDTMALVSYNNIVNSIRDVTVKRFESIINSYGSTEVVIGMSDVVGSMLNDYRNFGFMSYGSNIQEDLVFIIELGQGIFGNTQFQGRLGKSYLLDVAGNLIAEQSLDKKVYLRNFLMKKYIGVGRTKLVLDVLSLLE